ncbi:MAG: hypothetical protein ACR2GD_04105 [Pyrinomonadaceae bacterium]
MSIFNFESNDKNEWEIKIAKTNYFLAKLQELLEIRFEIYVKWGYGGAFNGAGLVGVNNSLSIVYFSDKKLELNNVIYSQFKVDYIWITVESTSPMEFDEVLRKANSEFNKLLIIEESETLN